MSIGKNIKEMRLARGWTQKQLGELCGMADSAVRRYETDRGNPTRTTLQKFADAFGVSIMTLENDMQGLIEAGANNEFWDASAEEDRVAAYGEQLIKVLNNLNAEGQAKLLNNAVELAAHPWYMQEETGEQQAKTPSETILGKGEYTDTTKQEKPPESLLKPLDGKQ